MFDENVQLHHGGKIYSLHLCARGSLPLPMVFQTWMAELSRDMLRLGTYFRAVAIMLQIPGASEYEFIGYECELADLVKATDQNELLNVLAQCLDRLGVAELMKQVPAPDYYTEELSEEWKEWLDKEGKVRNGLLNVVGECLDVLVVGPGMAEIEKAAELPWWNRFVPDK